MEFSAFTVPTPLDSKNPHYCYVFQTMVKVKFKYSVYSSQEPHSGNKLFNIWQEDGDAISTHTL